MHVHIERQRLIRWSREIGPCDPRINDHAVADKFREEYVLLVRCMQRANFTAVEPLSGDRLQADLDYIDQHAQLPHMRIPLMRSCLLESVPETSAMEVMKQESEKRMAKFMKSAAGEAVRADAVRNLGPHPSHAAGRVVLGVGMREPRVDRAGRLVSCNQCGFLGHFSDKCPDGGGHNRRQDRDRDRDRDRGGGRGDRGRGRGRGGNRQDRGDGGRDRLAIENGRDRRDD
jgi:hypothetical protein